MERKLNRILNMIHKLKEEGIIANSLSAGQIAGTPEAGDALGEYPRKKKRKKIIYKRIWKFSVKQ